MVGQILKTGHAEHPFLGIEPQTITPALARILHLPVANGMLVGKVDPGSGAATAGLRGRDDAGDRGRRVLRRRRRRDRACRRRARSSSLAVLRDLIAAKEPGDTVTLTVYRSAQADDRLEAEDRARRSSGGSLPLPPVAASGKPCFPHEPLFAERVRRLELRPGKPGLPR